MKAFGDERAVLARYLGVSEAAVSYWVNGRNLPRREIIEMIAARYLKTVDEILYEDFSQADDPKVPASKRVYDEIGMSLMVMIDPEYSVESVHFRRGIEAQRRVWRDIIRGRDLEADELIRVLDEYQMAIEKDACVEAACNLFSISLLCWLCGAINPEVVEGLDKRWGAQESMRRFALRVVKGDIPQYRMESTEDLVNREDDLQRLLRIIKRSPQYYDVADYFQALRLIVGYVGNGNSRRMNQKIGSEWMLYCANTGNKYALRFLACYNTL